MQLDSTAIRIAKGFIKCDEDLKEIIAQQKSSLTPEIQKQLVSFIETLSLTDLDYQFDQTITPAQTATLRKTDHQLIVICRNLLTQFDAKNYKPSCPPDLLETIENLETQKAKTYKETQEYISYFDEESKRLADLAKITLTEVNIGSVLDQEVLCMKKIQLFYTSVNFAMDLDVAQKNNLRSCIREIIKKVNQIYRDTTFTKIPSIETQDELHRIIDAMKQDKAFPNYTYTESTLNVLPAYIRDDLAKTGQP